MNRYMMPLDENELFEWGVAAFRMDIGTYKVMREALDKVTWTRPDDIPANLPGHVPENPLGTAEPEVRSVMAEALQTMISDPSLAPNLAKMGHFTVSGLEIQNGSYDDNWHHDGLAGKRHGHAGDFFLLAYFGTKHWDPVAGGQFEYAQRDLEADWSTSGFIPRSEIRRVDPVDRQVVLGWNQNPRLIHRAAPLTAPVDRVTLIASLDFHTR